MRITTGMIQRNVLSDLNGLSEKLARTQAKASSGREITRPSDNPFGAAKAMGLRATLAANDLLVRGANDTADQTSRNAIASEIDQIIQGIKESANASYGDKYLMSGTATSIAPYKLGADDAYQGDEAGLDPAIPGVIREIGPGVTMSINTVAREILGDGRAAPADGKLLNTLRDIADHLRAGDGTALRGGDMSGLKGQLDSLLEVRARNGAMTNRLEAGSTRLSQIQEAVTKQLSETEDADVAKTIIEFNSQSAAYQASLRAGANIVQSSLMDFLR